MSQEQPGAAIEAGTEGGSLNSLAVSATTHCLTGCAMGEIVGMAIATALGWGNVARIALAVARAADTVSITIMEVIDNLTVVLWPGAMGAGVGDPILYISIASAS
ncbi:MAG: DUF4396 domain-containing protein [Solirubrobacterales bacterium]